MTVLGVDNGGELGMILEIFRWIRGRLKHRPAAVIYYDV